jgi:integrase
MLIAAVEVAIPIGLLGGTGDGSCAVRSRRHSWREQGMVFATALGTLIEPRNLNRHFDRLRRKAEVRPVRFHDLRHSCATLLYDQA